MQIGKILFPITTLGPGRRLGIWTQGCNRFCVGCSNPELQTFDESKSVTPEEIFECTSAFPYDGITVSGGEPFLQAADLKRLLTLYLEAGCEDILVYTGFTIRQLMEKKDEDVNWILANIAALIDGPFVEALVDDTPLRGSSNQGVWIFNAKYKQAYENVMSGEKKVDVFRFADEVHFIGIPFQDYDALYKELLKNRRK